MQSVFEFCPVCGTDAIAIEELSVKRVKDRRVSWRTIGFLFLPVLLLGFGVAFTVAPWFQNLSMNLESENVGLELQVGKQSSNWLDSTSTFRAKVSLPNNLSDSATVKLERLEDEIWVEEDSNEVTQSATVPLQHSFSSPGKQSVRVSLYSGSDLVQTSDVKSVTGVKAPKGLLKMKGNVLYREFSQPEYDSVSLPGCGSACLAYWVSTPTKSTVTIWVEDKGQDLTKKVKVTITKVGVLKQVTLSLLGLGKTGTVSIESRPATGEEIRQANEPEPSPIPTPNTGKNTPAGCEKLSVLLLRREEVDRWIRTFFPPSPATGGWDFETYQNERFMQARGELWDIETEMKRCY